MTNFEKLKQELTIDEMAEIIDNGADETACQRCAYSKNGESVQACESHDCIYGITTWLKRVVKKNKGDL